MITKANHKKIPPTLGNMYSYKSYTRLTPAIPSKSPIPIKKNMRT